MNEKNEEQLADALVQLKLSQLKIDEKDEQIHELDQRVALLEQENKILKQNLEYIQWKPALSLLHVPNKVIRLQQILEEEPFRIKYVQQKWEQFVIWRYDLVQQVGAATEESMNEFDIAPIEIIAHQFSTIDQLGLRLCDKLWEMILNCIDQSRVPMSVLSDCLDVIVQTDDKTQTEHDQVVRSAMYQVHCTGNDGLIKYESMKKRCELTLGKAIAKQCKETIQAITNRSRRQSEFSESDGQLLKTLYVVEDLLVGAFPIGYAVNAFFMSRILSELTKQLKELSESAQEMDIYSTFRIVNWIGVSQRDAVALGMDALVSCFDEADDLFTSAYLVVIQKQVKDASEQLVRRAYTAKSATEGYLYTDAVEELVGYVVQQVKFLQQYLSGQRLREAVHLCTTIFQARQQYQHDDLISINNSNLENLLPQCYIEHVCAVVNDSYRIQNDIMEIFVTCETKLDTNDKELLQNFLHEVSCGFDSVVDEAIRTLTLIIFRDLASTLAELFTDRWLLGTAKPILSMLATFDDYLVDIDRWLKQSFHLRDLRDSLISRLVRQYIERLNELEVAFRSDEMGRVAEAIFQDSESIQEYERKNRQTQQPESSTETRLMSSTVILDLISTFFTSSDPSMLFPELAKELGKSIGPILSRLIKYRSDLPDSRSKQLKMDLKEWELWAEHNAPSSTRFHVAREIEPASSHPSRATFVRVQKAQKMLGKGFEKAKAEAKAKRSSFVKGVQGVSNLPFRRRSGPARLSSS